MPIMQAQWGLTLTIAVVAGVALVGLLVSVVLRDELYAGSRLRLREDHQQLMAFAAKGEALTEAGPA